jgi:plasmid rolling circle replication initiator protein Rep
MAGDIYKNAPWRKKREAMVQKMEILQARTYKKTAKGEPSFHEK